MKTYEVFGGVARFGPGQEMKISDAQYQRRKHNLEVVEKGNEKKPWHVKARTRIEFKVGETVGLPSMPAALAHIMAPQGAPETKAEEVAVAARDGEEYKPVKARTAKEKRQATAEAKAARADSR